MLTLNNICSTLVQVLACRLIWRQAITGTNAAILSIWPSGNNFTQILVQKWWFSFKKIHLKVTSAEWRPFCFLPQYVNKQCYLLAINRWSSIMQQAWIIYELHPYKTSNMVKLDHFSWSQSGPSLNVNTNFPHRGIPIATCHQHTYKSLTHWGWVTHICIGKLTIIGSDDGLTPVWYQVFIWTNAGILLIVLLGTNFSEILMCDTYMRQ